MVILRTTTKKIILKCSKRRDKTIKMMQRKYLFNTNKRAVMAELRNKKYIEHIENK